MASHLGPFEEVRRSLGSCRRRIRASSRGKLGDIATKMRDYENACNDKGHYVTSTGLRVWVSVTEAMAL